VQAVGDAVRVAIGICPSGGGTGPLSSETNEGLSESVSVQMSRPTGLVPGSVLYSRRELCGFVVP
jgi:hypothetical protein